MKILFVFNHPAPYKINLINELAKEHEIDVIFERDKNKNRNPLFYHNSLKTTQIKISGIRFGDENHFSFSLKNYIKKHYKKYNLIIMNGYSTISEIIAINFMIKHHIQYSLYVNGGIIKNDNKRKFNLKSKLISHANHYFSPCKQVNDYLIHYGADANKIFNYTYSTVYEKEMLANLLSQKNKLLMREKLNIKGETILVTAGQFIDRKNNEQLLRFVKDYPEIVLYIIGDGPNKHSYERFIKENDMKNAAILPYKSKLDLFEYFRAADMFITLSKEDIYGHMINEAFSQGLPVISSNKVVAARHLVKNGFNGLIVDLSDLTPIKSFIKNPENDILAQNSLATAHQNTVEIMVSDHLNILKEIEKCM